MDEKELTEQNFKNLRCEGEETMAGNASDEPFIENTTEQGYKGARSHVGDSNGPSVSSGGPGVSSQSGEQSNGADGPEYGDLSDPEAQLRVYEREIQLFAAEGKGYKGLCPLHDDHNPSFRIDFKDGSWVWFCDPCGEGGNAFGLLKRLGKLPKFENGGKAGQDPTAVYHYTDENGKILFQVLRYGEGKGKTFKQRRPNGNGGWEWNVPEEIRTLYNLPAVTKGDQVLIVEGEKDAETARKLGFTATTNPGGATKWLPRYSELLAGKDLIVIPDDDVAGEKHRKIVLKSLCESPEHPRSIKVVKVPAGKDLTEWVQAGGDAKQLTDLVEKTEHFAYVDPETGEFIINEDEESQGYGVIVVCKDDSRTYTYKKMGLEALPWERGEEERLALELSGKNAVLTFQNEALVTALLPEVQSLKIVTTVPKSAGEFLALIEKAPERRIRLIVSDGDRFLEKDIKPREVLMETQKGVPIFYAQSINQLFAWRGLGKTYIALAIVDALVHGRQILNWKAKRPIKVLYVEGEIPEYQMQERLRQVIGKSDEYLRIITLDEQPDNEIPSLSTRYGRKLVEEALGDAEVLILDSISTLFNFSTNEEEHWLDVMAWLKKLRSKGLCIIFLHHAGKSGLQRGASKSEDLLDISIKLERPSDYHLDDGLRVNLRFDKTRGVVMLDGEVEVAMTIDNDHAEFVYGPIGKESKKNSENYEKAKEYFRRYPDKSLEELEKISAIPKSTLWRYKKDWSAEEDREEGPETQQKKPASRQSTTARSESQGRRA